MKLAAAILIPTMISWAHVTVSLAADSTDPLSGLPLVPNSRKLADPEQSYKYCGKNAKINGYFYMGSSDNDNEDLVATAKAWYVKAMPHANVFSAPGTGQVTLVTADGTSAVTLSGAVISFLHFSPGLSPAEMKGLGNVPASRECQAG
jgi:hypothetical protein